MSAPVTFLSLSLFLLTCSLPSAILSGSYSLFWNRSHSALSRLTSGTESVRDRAQILYRAGGRLSLGTLSDRLDSGLLGLSCAAVVIGRFHETIRKREWKELTQRIKIMPYTKKASVPGNIIPLLLAHWETSRKMCSLSWLGTNGLAWTTFIIASFLLLSSPRKWLPNENYRFAKDNLSDFFKQASIRW